MKLKKWIALLTALMLLAGVLPVAAHADDDCKRSPTGRHEWQGWMTVKGPTCTSKGTRMRKCRYCQNEQTESIPAKGHSWSKWKTTKEATCTKEGEQTRKCKVCDKKDTRKIDKKPHSWGDWEIVVEPTDHSAGTRTHTCKVCGTEKSEDFDPEGTLRRGNKGDAVKRLQEGLICYGVMTGKVDGSFGSGTEKAVMAAQEGEGLTADGVAWPQTQARLGHRFGEWQVLSEETDFSVGLRRRVCGRCGYAEEEETWPEPTYRRGDRGDGVRDLQEKLNAAGYDCGRADGSFGGKTETAIKAIEQAHGVEADGIAWPGVQKWLEPGTPDVATYSDGDIATDFLDRFRDAPVAMRNKDDPLRITKQPVDGIIPWAEYIVHEGARGRTKRRDPNAEKLLLSVAVSGGEEPYTYQWYRAVMFRVSDGEPKGRTIGGDAPELSVSNDGSYYCEITDNAGDKVRSDIVKARFALHIVRQPQHASLYGGDSAAITCLVEGGNPAVDGEYTYEWFTSVGDPVPDGWADGPTLNVPEEGEFYCVASDGETSVQSDTALVYSWKPMSLISNGDRLTTVLGEDGYQKTYLADGGLPPYTFVWEKDGVELDSLTTDTDHPYYTATFTVMDYGLYTCTLTDAMVGSDSKDFHVEYDQLSIRHQPEGGVLPADGDPFFLAITMDEGEAPFTYTLFRNGEPWCEESLSQDFVSVGVDQSGVYHYHIEDANGRWADSDHVAVNDYKVSIKQYTQEAEIRNRRKGGPNVPADLTVEVEGGLAPYVYVWESSADGAIYKPEKTLKTSDTTCTIPASTPGTYRCAVTDANEQTAIATGMMVRYAGEAPLIVEQPDDVRLDYMQGQTAYEVALSCRAITGDGEDQYLEYAWESMEPGAMFAPCGKGCKLEVDDLTGARFFRCTVTDTRTGRSEVSRMARVEIELLCITPETYESLSYHKGRLDYEIWGGTPPYTVEVMQHRMTVAKEGKVDFIDARERVFTVDAPSGDLSIDLPDTYYDFIWYDEEGMPTIQKTQAEYYLIVTDAIDQDVTTPPMHGAYKQN
ncbi:MAG: peptidoglycan-binding protein [Clostridia bacterium]|nr:peptidoglycan-binding protein [Clostridia bacterium]